MGLAAGVAALALTAAACGSSPSSASDTSHDGGTSSSSGGGASATPVTVTVGYFPNITHAPALVGMQEGLFAKALKPDVVAKPQIFSAGPAENTALLAGSIDLAFEGPSSALSAFTASHGAVSIIAGVAQGGAGLVVKKSITSAGQLQGTKLGSPQLGNTQDVALRYWLKQHGLTTTSTGGGDVHIEPSTTGSGTVVTEFKAGQIDGAWLAEPYEQELIAAGGHLLQSEAGATTDLVVRNSFLRAHPATVKRFLTGLLDTFSFIQADKAQAERAANKQLATLEGGKPLPSSVLSASWANLTFGPNPQASTLETQVKQGEAVGLLSNPGSIAKIFDLAPLNAPLQAKGQTTVAGM